MSRSLTVTADKLAVHLEKQGLVPPGIPTMVVSSFGIIDKRGRQALAVDANGAITFPLSGAVAASDTTLTGTLAVTSTSAFSGNIAVATNKFTVAAASGNTAVAGTLAVTGASTLTGNVTASGTLAVTGALTGASSIKSSSPTAGIGYATGAGGTVTQGTSRTTGVTLNTVCGNIVLFSGAGSATPFSFTVTNSAVAVGDTIRICQKSGTDKYTTQQITAVGAGSFEVTLANASGTTTEQPVFNFSVTKGVAA